MHGNRSKGSKKGRLLVGLVAAMGFTQGAVAASSLQCAATELSAPVSKIELMPDTLGVAVESAVNGQRYQILIHRPSATVKEPPGGFPVLYVLDGNATFVLAAQAARLQERLTGGLIVVGVDAQSNALFDPPARYRDLTTPAADNAWGVPKDRNGGPLKTGGADAYRDFLVNEVAAVVDGCMHVNKQRTTLFGHSLAGLFVLHTLLTHPDSYDRYIAASPSIWWNDRAVLNELSSLRTDRSGGRKALHLMVGGAEQTLAASAPAVRVDRVTHAAMNDNVQLLYTRLKQEHSDDVDVALDVFSGANHVSYLPAALSAAVTEAATR
ncbi:putative alpha/beta superfamily hydrolase [Paraburkholderia sp. GAS333]